MNHSRDSSSSNRGTERRGKSGSKGKVDGKSKRRGVSSSSQLPSRPKSKDIDESLIIDLTGSGYDYEDDIASKGSDKHRHHAHSNKNTNDRTSNSKVHSSSNRSNGLQTNSNSSTSTASAENTGEWPASLQNFLAQSYLRSNNVLNDSGKIQFNNQLQQLIARAIEKNLIFKNDWVNQKIPILDGVKDLVLASELNGSSPLIHQQASMQANSLTDPPPKTPTPTDFDSSERKKHRSERFDSPTVKPKSTISIKSASPTAAIVGRSEALEKDFLRLTTAPNPDNVRPQKILEQSHKLVVSEYEKGRPYSYALNQFKSMRQDLTVQHIQNDFTILVYEKNGKISLENNDLGEYNQCQSQLNYLYYKKRKEDPKWNNRFFRLEAEYLVYRIIYMIITNNFSEIYKMKLTILRKYASFTKTSKEASLFRFIQLLYKLVRDIATENYHDFFFQLRSYDFKKDLDVADIMIRNHLYEKNRLKFLHQFASSYHHISTDQIVEEMNFADTDDLRKFLKKNKLQNFFLGDVEQDYKSLKAQTSMIVAKTNFNKVDIKGQI
ncbi:SAC3/GANP/Nin1/mts3/eIF-3 p25 family-domain-containing protein [Scheffersomyces xylosifermentans]|uniref:SAC3/GANP/Nin1/mts3/eIF-3 p25 family-domain-containing protein n=1 Tax=Scheffersomyces xylosifermentans TaxID=1304137 RepID=UPI00315C9A09